jgi:Fe2+ or Zn2+ uptake regulation protein
MDDSLRRNLFAIKASRKGSGARFAILKVLEEHSEGLPVMSIYKCLNQRGLHITQPAVSQNIEVLERKGIVWKNRVFNKEAKRELWHYISSVPFFDSIAEDISKEIMLELPKSIQRNVNKAPRFEDFLTLQGFLENVILHASESAIFGEKLYIELSKRKPYAESAVLIREYTKAVSTIKKAIETNTRFRTVCERRIKLHLPSSLTLSNPYDIARAIVDGAIKGEKRYFHSIDFLQKNTTGDLSERLAESSAWIKGRSGLPAKGGE